MFPNATAMSSWLDDARVALTGASSGIGLALTRRISNRTRHLIACGLRPASELPGSFPRLREPASYLCADLATSQGVEALLAGIEQCRWEGLDALILNAGTGRHCTIENETPETIDQAVALNLVSTIELAHALHDRLLAGNGRLVIVGSSAHQGASNFAVYAATKAALNGFARALRSEWQGRISVQIIHPGPTSTALHARAGYDPGRMGAYFMSAEKVGEAMLAQMGRGRSPAYVNWATLLMNRLRRP